MKLNLGAGTGEAHLPEPVVNLDPSTGWRFQDGLDYLDSTVAGITVSHALMYVPLSELPAVFSELFRVLEPGGVVRITEDNTEDPASERYGGWHDAVTLTGPDVVREHLKQAGFKVRKQTADSSGFKDRSLIQAWHGEEPKVFFIEGRKP